MSIQDRLKKKLKEEQGNDLHEVQEIEDMGLFSRRTQLKKPKPIADASVDYGPSLKELEDLKDAMVEIAGRAETARELLDSFKQDIEKMTVNLKAVEAYLFDLSIDAYNKAKDL